MNTAIATRKPKAAKVVNIQNRQDFGNGVILYTCLSSNGVDQHWTTLKDGHATHCTCRELPNGAISRHTCYHMTGCEQNERERATDIQQHVHDDLHSCIYCGRPMGHDGVCARCA